MATLHHLPKKRGALKSTQKSLFFERPNFPGLSQCEKKGKGARVEELRKLWPLWFVTFHVCAFGPQLVS